MNANPRAMELSRNTLRKTNACFTLCSLLVGGSSLAAALEAQLHQTKVKGPHEFAAFPLVIHAG
jgi:hypothetical protein